MNQFGDVIEYSESLKIFTGQNYIWAFGNSTQTTLIFPHMKLQDEWRKVKEKAKYISPDFEAVSLGKPNSMRRFAGLVFENAYYSAFFGRHEYDTQTGQMPFFMPEGIFLGAIIPDEAKKIKIERAINIPIAAITRPAHSEEVTVHFAGFDKPNSRSPDILANRFNNLCFKKHKGACKPEPYSRLDIDWRWQLGSRVLSLRIKPKDFTRLFESDTPSPKL